MAATSDFDDATLSPRFLNNPPFTLYLGDFCLPLLARLRAAYAASSSDKGPCIASSLVLPEASFGEGGFSFGDGGFSLGCGIGGLAASSTYSTFTYTCSASLSCAYCYYYGCYGSDCDCACCSGGTGVDSCGVSLSFSSASFRSELASGLVWVGSVGPGSGAGGVGGFP